MVVEDDDVLVVVVVLGDYVIVGCELLVACGLQLGFQLGELVGVDGFVWPVGVYDGVEDDPAYEVDVERVVCCVVV